MLEFASIVFVHNCGLGYPDSYIYRRCNCIYSRLRSPSASTGSDSADFFCNSLHIFSFVCLAVDTCDITIALFNSFPQLVSTVVLSQCRFQPWSSWMDWYFVVPFQCGFLSYGLNILFDLVMCKLNPFNDIYWELFLVLIVNQLLSHFTACLDGALWMVCSSEFL